MAEAARVQVDGASTLARTLARAARALPDIAPPEAARVIGQAARQNAPRRTGRLAASWAPDDSPGVLGLGFGAPHAAPIHWGVGARVGLRGPHNIRPSLYLLRAIDSTRNQWVEEYAQEIETIIGKVRGA